MSKCKYCPAEVLWRNTPAGSVMPLDPDPDPARGNVRIVVSGGDIQAVTLSAPEALAAREAGQPLFVSHWATCPGAEKARADVEAKRAATLLDELEEDE